MRNERLVRELAVDKSWIKRLKREVIYAERGGGDSNPRRTRAYARSVIRRLKVVWPGLANAVDENHKNGIVIMRSAPPLIADRQRLKA